VKWPGNIAPGTVRADLVAVVDFAPTFLTMAGAEIPKEMQGRPFLAPKGQPQPEPRKYVYSARDRMDETLDRIRAVRDDRYRLVRNFHPELPYAQRVQYGEQMPTMREWRRLNAEGKLNPTQALFFAPTKPVEEFYDVQADPHEVHNLINSTEPAHVTKIRELRAALGKWLADTKDLGATPEEELVKQGLVKDFFANYADRKQGAQPAKPAGQAKDE
jgi:N-sulfoglucosamine sulfohydrolase